MILQNVKAITNYMRKTGMERLTAFLCTWGYFPVGMDYLQPYGWGGKGYVGTQYEDQINNPRVDDQCYFCICLNLSRSLGERTGEGFLTCRRLMHSIVD